MVKKFDNDGVFTGNSRKNLFTIIAKDNIDVNSKSTKVGQHYHLISMAIMQFLSNENYNGLQQTLYDLSKESSWKLELPESYTNFKQLPLKKHSPLFSPVSTYTIDNIFDNKNNDEAIKDEIDWRNQLSLSNLDNCIMVKTPFWSSSAMNSDTGNTFNASSNKQKSSFSDVSILLYDYHPQSN